jgi:hypothetical protein
MTNTQTFLTIGAMIILGFVAMRFNSAMITSQNADLGNKVYLTAFSVANNIIEQAKVKNFDQTTINFPTTNPATLSSVLGPDDLPSGGKETKYDFNDVDDYNDYADSVAKPYFETYHIHCWVHYVKANDQDQISTTQTFYKKFTVTVRSDYLTNPDSVSLSCIFTLK